MFEKDKISNEEKESIINRCEAEFDPAKDMPRLETAAAEPITRSLEYTCLARKLLMTQEDPPMDAKGRICVYPDTDRKYMVFTDEFWEFQNVPGKIVQEEVFIKPVVVEDNRDMINKPFLRRRFSAFDRLQIKAKETIEQKETALVVNGLLYAAKKEKKIYESGWHPYALRKAFLQLEQAGKTVSKMVVNPKQFSEMQMWGHDFFEDATVRERLTSGLWGHIWTADIHVTPQIPEDWVVLVSYDAGDFLIVDNPKVKIKWGERVDFGCAEKIGLGIYTDSVAAMHVKEEVPMSCCEKPGPAVENSRS